MSSTPLTRDDLEELHCIQPIATVASILELGILSHARAVDVPHESVAMEEIQARRADVVIPGTGRQLHEYANLYVNGRNKMLSKLKFTRGVDGLCVLSVTTDVLDLDGVIIADQNASTDTVLFAPSPRGLRNIAQELVFARYWTHPGNPIAERRHGQIICAEVLVPDRVAPEYIEGAYVCSDESAERLRAEVPDDFDVTVDPYLFFRGEPDD